MKKVFLMFSVLLMSALVIVSCKKDDDKNDDPEPTPTPTPIEPTIPGAFSVNSGEFVFFSQGNLTYNVTAQTWGFYENSYDCATGYDENIISLFTWGCGDWSTDPSTTAYQAGEFIDWSSKINDGKNWRTPTRVEWQYLFRGRYTPSGVRYAKAKMGNMIGFILVPDDWNTDIYELVNVNTQNAEFTSNRINVSTWNETFKPAGCVFLPAAGYRNGTNVEKIGEDGYYWTSSSNEFTDKAECLQLSICPDGIYSQNRSCGCSVRLIYSAE